MSTFNFPPTSRYFGIAINSLTRPDGEPVPYLARRFLPASDRFSVLRVHPVTAGERLDLIAAAELGDPEAFWRICDANDAMRPDDLVTLGRPLKITLPEGIPGTPIG
jgi:hypothetical protein